MRLKLREDTQPVPPDPDQRFPCCEFLSFLFCATHTVIPTVHMMQATDAMEAGLSQRIVVNLIFESSLICSAQQKHNEKDMELEKPRVRMGRLGSNFTRQQSFLIPFSGYF